MIWVNILRILRQQWDKHIRNDDTSSKIHQEKEKAVRISSLLRLLCQQMFRGIEVEEIKENCFRFYESHLDIRGLELLYYLFDDKVTWRVDAGWFFIKWLWKISRQKSFIYDIQKIIKIIKIFFNIINNFYFFHCQQEMVEKF